MKKNFKNQIRHYLVSDKLFYETIDCYRYNKNYFLKKVEKKINNNWKIIKKGIWINVISKSQIFPVQGWKIHISSTLKDSKKIIEIVSSILIKENVSFKFLSDDVTFCLMNSKSSDRASSGKFITIYPSNDFEFKKLIEKLYKKLKNFNGPYILSDKRYKDCKVLYYRYGGFKFNGELTPYGYKVPIIYNNGKKIPDQRVPYFKTPYGIKDIFEDYKSESKESELLNGRYNIIRPVGFSNTGGIYIAKDLQEKKKVIIKEFRPFIFFKKNVYSHDIAKREWNSLKKLQKYLIVPRPIEFFKEWEHVFLVQEYLNGYINLSEYAVLNNCLYSKPYSFIKERDVLKLIKKFVVIFQKLYYAIEILHRNSICFGDFSASNIMINPKNLDLKLIDFEGSTNYKKKEKAVLFTFGFASKEHSKGNVLSPYDDYYSMGHVMFNFLTGMNEILEIYPEFYNKILDELQKDFKFPEDIITIIKDLRDLNLSVRKKGFYGIRHLVAKIDYAKKENIHSTSKIEKISKELINGSLKYVLNNVSYDREDRLFPSDPELFETNPLSIAFGASGVVYSIFKTDKKYVSIKMINWIKKNISNYDIPPGLFIGMSGISWFFLELGGLDYAETLFSKTFESNLLYSSFNIYSGLSGWGITNLKFYLITGKEKYKNNAIKAGDYLIRLVRMNEKGAYWKDKYQDNIKIGYMHGSSGIALFLIYLYKITKRQDYKEVAIKALDYDLNNKIRISKNLYSWGEELGNTKVVYPYLEYGSAGIGLVVLRFYKILKFIKYKNVLEKIYYDCDRKYSVLPCKSLGISGIGEFVLDMYNFYKENRYLTTLNNIVKFLEISAIRKKKGISFAGKGLIRESCDYFTGSAGIISFLSRILKYRALDFTLDDLI
ncbi:MAG: class III lanthionine synthetase LanKC [Elusimicrobiales bacterium]